MKRLLLCLTMLLFTAGIGLAKNIECVDPCRATLDVSDDNKLVVLVHLNCSLTALDQPGVQEVLTDPATYVVTAPPANLPGSLTPAVTQTYVRVGPPYLVAGVSDQVYIPIDASLVKDRLGVRVKVNGRKTARYELKSANLAATISKPYKLASSSTTYDVAKDGATWVADIGYSHNSRWRHTPGRSLKKDQFVFEGTIPATVAEGVPNLLQATYRIQRFDGETYTLSGVVARSTRDLDGVELVYNYQQAAFRNADNSVFLGAEGEAGYRSGALGWQNVTQPATDTSHIVARLGGVAEWVPRLGRINLDPGAGLRFFVRGRGWLDYGHNVTDQGSQTRFRGFLDAELFYNFTNQVRGFVRYEYGALPPMLNQHTNRVYLGVGKPF